MRIIRLLFISCFSLFCFPGFAQNENNIWHFGYYAALDFNSGSPALITNSAMSVGEGSASVCNSSGQLLFYTDGEKIWDRNNTQMPNGFGLMGDLSSTQSAVICRDPGNSSRYYVFTSDQGGYAGPNQGIYYNIVDMTLNNGAGDVMLKNQLVCGPLMTEKIIAIRHCNGNDFWIVAHEYNSNRFKSYLLSSSGLNTTPVVSVTGSVHSATPSCATAIGWMNASADGSRIGLSVNYPLHFTEVFDFDRSTGMLSNPIHLVFANVNVNTSGGNGPYGAAFSPDGSKFYASWNGWPGCVVQYDLSSGNPAYIQASQTVLITANALGAVQLGPDGKIYVSQSATNSLACISQPNLAGAACNYTANAVNLGSAYAQLGLPNTVEYAAPQAGSNQDLLGQDVAICSPDSITFSVASYSGTYLWSTGETTASITVHQQGTYWVQITGTDCNPPMSDTVTVNAGSDNDFSAPNVFTPNNDGINDFFVPVSVQTDQFRLEIYNRWGQKVFISSDPSVSWDGLSAGNSCDAGVYFWTANFLNCTGREISKTGFVELLR